MIHVNWVPCHQGSTEPRVAHGGEGPGVWKVVANIRAQQTSGDRQIERWKRI